MDAVALSFDCGCRPEHLGACREGAGAQDHAGISFVNGQFMAGIEVAETNRGPVKFTACGFWNIPTTDSHATLAGLGHATFDGCHFIGWGKKDPEAPCIHAERGGVTFTACDFMDPTKPQAVIEPEVDAALVFGNRFRWRERVLNKVGDCAPSATNVVWG